MLILLMWLNFLWVSTSSCLIVFLLGYQIRFLLQYSSCQFFSTIILVNLDFHPRSKSIFFYCTNIKNPSPKLWVTIIKWKLPIMMGPTKNIEIKNWLSKNLRKSVRDSKNWNLKLLLRYSYQRKDVSHKEWVIFVCSKVKEKCSSVHIHIFEKHFEKSYNNRKFLRKRKSTRQLTII